MALYCYFIACSRPELEEIPYPPLHGAPLHFIRHAGLIAAVRLLPAGSRVTPQWVLDYNAVLTAASRRASVLPGRFGAGFRDESAVIRLLASRRAELEHALAWLAGKAEMGLKARVEEGENPAETAARLGKLCGALDSRFEVRSAPAAESILDLVHLIERNDVEGYRQRSKPYAIDVSGPWPPLHFLPQFLRRPVRAERGSSRRARAQESG